MPRAFLFCPRKPARGAAASRTGRPSGRLARLAVLAAAVLSVSCEDPVVLGVRAHELRDRLLTGDRSLILDSPPARLAELARLGPGALYYAARAAGRAGVPERETVLLKLATEREEGLFRSRAWALYPEALYKAGDWAGLLEFTDRQRQAGVDAYLPRRRRAEALAGLGRPEEARAELDALTADYPGEAEKDAALLAVLRLRTAADPAERAARTRELFALPDAAPEDMAAALAAAEAAAGSAERTADAPEDDELALFRLRTEVGRRDYGAAYRAVSGRAASLLSPGLPRAYLSDAGKAFLYAPALKEGLDATADLESRASVSDAPGAREARYVALFYRARILRQADRRAEAAEAFARAWELAPSEEDRDAAAWYRADCLAAGSRAEAAAWLARTAPSWRSPAAFADIVERLAREALLAKDGDTLYVLRTEVAPRMTPRASTRLVYLAGRAAETRTAPSRKAGASAPDTAEYAKAAYEEVLARSPEPYYRLLAAYRLGLPLFDPPVSRPPAPKPPRTGSAREQRRAGPDAETYLSGFADFGLAELIPQEIRALEGTPDAPDTEALRWLSLRLRDAREYAQSMIVMNRLFENPGYEASREDWELLWPRPWPEEVAGSAAEAGMTDYLLYGLVRSESFFRPAVVSRAGAIGLAQLMPATAEETARRLRMGSYDLENPADNLRLGSTHFARLLSALNGRVLPSVFAYNAGLTRMRGWERAAPGFPDDLLLESLSIEETRQYGRNVLWASFVYGVLYYGLDERAALAEMLGEPR